MSCPSCSKEIPAEAVFCRYCGANISIQKKLIQEGYAETVQTNATEPPIHFVVKTTSREESVVSKFLNIFYKIPGIIRVILVFVVLNVVLWGAQELYYQGDTQKMTLLDAEISTMDSQIKNMEIHPSTTTQSQYESLLNKRNKEADEYNALAKSSGSRWYLIPIPTGHHTTIH